MCIFTINPGINEDVIKITPQNVEVHEFYLMLDSAFPYREETHHLNFWDFHMVTNLHARKVEDYIIFHSVK